MKRKAENKPLPSDHNELLLTVSAAREKFTSIVARMDEDPSMVVKVANRKTPIARLVSEARYGAVIDAMQEGQLVPILVRLVANKWLGINHIPAHLYHPQIDELESLTQPQLVALYQADPDSPLSSILQSTGLNESLIERLLKRRNICQAITNAEDGDLYTTSEHFSGASDT